MEQQLILPETTDVKQPITKLTAAAAIGAALAATGVNAADNKHMFGNMPASIDFPIGFEPTKVDSKKYVMDADSGRYINTVGTTFKAVSHPEFFGRVNSVIKDALSAEELQGATAIWRSANEGGWAMMDLTLPNTVARVTTDKHEVDVGQRIVAMHGIDGSCSNQVFFGAIDFFCTNGMITGDYRDMRRKNTSGFSIDGFVRELEKSKGSFDEHIKNLNKWAKVGVDINKADEVLRAIIPTETKREKMITAFSQEASKRGFNQYALYSAFTNYATFADEQNGFKLSNTGKDTAACNMWKREQEVMKWINSPAFKELKAA